LAPPTEIALTTRFVVPGLALSQTKSSTGLWLVEPTSVAGKPTDVGLMLALGLMPLPVTDPESGHSAASQVTVSVPERVPVPVGWKLMLMVQLPPGAICTDVPPLPLTVMAQWAGQPQQHIDTAVESAMLQLDQAELPTLGKASRRARELNAQLLVAIGRLQSAYILASQEITGQQRQNVLPGPDGAVPVVHPQLRQPS
jgi:hypothetical protein